MQSVVMKWNYKTDDLKVSALIPHLSEYGGADFYQFLLFGGGSCFDVKMYAVIFFKNYGWLPLPSKISSSRMR